METPVYDTLAAVSLGMTQHNIVLEREREGEPSDGRAGRGSKREEMKREVTVGSQSSKSFDDDGFRGAVRNCVWLHRVVTGCLFRRLLGGGSAGCTTSVVCVQCQHSVTKVLM